MNANEMMRRHYEETRALRLSGGYLTATYGTDDTVQRYAEEAVYRCKHTATPQHELSEFGACAYCIAEAMRALLADPAPPGAVTAAEEAPCEPSL